MKKIKHIFTLFIVLYLNSLHAQDLHFSRVQDMVLWYNPSLKNDTRTSLRMNYRDVRYQGLLGYRSSAMMVDLPVISQITNKETSGYWNLSAGFSLDQSNQNILNQTQALLGVSYALPLNANQLYLASSVQASYFKSRLDVSGINFPDQFDRNGPIANAITGDPLGNGQSQHWFSTHLGISMFQNTDLESWMLGVSVRDISQPIINRDNSASFHLKPTFGIQGGYEFIRQDTRYGIYGVANFKAQAYEQLLSISARRQFPGQNLAAIGGGLAYRIRDAIIPYIDLTVGQTTMALHYELNISGIQASGFKRSAFEIALMHRFNTN